MKILFVVYNAVDTCSYYRSAGIVPDLRSRTVFDIDVLTWNNEFHWANLINYNLIMMQRPCSNMALEMGIYAKNMGIPLWVDYDDLLIDVPWDNNVFESYPEKIREIIKKTIRIADVVSVTTMRLKQEIEPYSDNIHIIPNAFNDYVFRRREDPLKRTRYIAWRGSETHTGDLMAVAEPILRAVGKYPGWAFVFMGLRPAFLGRWKNLLHFRSTDPMVYFRNMVNMAPALFHVPLNDNVFNRCKSSIAYIEAAHVGSICLAPDWDEWRKPGVLLYKNNWDYFELMETVIQDIEDGGSYTMRQADEAWEFVSDNLRLSQINKLRVELINSVI